MKVFIKGFSHKLLLLISLCVFMVNCAHIRHLDQAQDAFSKGAEIENAIKFSKEVDPFLGVSSTSYYNLAYAEVKEALKNAGKLRSDTLLANAYTLQALCEWKLKRYHQAQISANNALSEIKRYESYNIFLERDKSLMFAMPGLIAVDLVNDQLNALLNDPDATLHDIKSFYQKQVHQITDNDDHNAKLQKALQELEEAKTTDRTSHALRLYLIQCQLAGMKVWSDAFTVLFRASRDDAEATMEEKMAMRTFIQEERAHFEESKQMYLAQLAKRLKLRTPPNHPVYNYWNNLM